MIKFYDFSKQVNEDELFYAFSPQSRTRNKFTQENGYIRNKEMPVEEGKVRTLHDNEHISLLTKERYGEGTTITLECAFIEFGAPLILLTDELTVINGRKSYDRHYEVVAYEDGANVWTIRSAPERTDNRGMDDKLLYSHSFPIAPKSRIVIKTTILDGGLKVEVNGNKFTVEIPNLPKKCHVGLTSCEGINHFYSLKIEQ